MRLVTVGHGTLPASAMVELLQGAGIEHLVDIRTAPGSRRNPQYRRSELEEWLTEAGISYRWEPDLGGLRKPAPDSPHMALRSGGFRAYADHMGTERFRAALDRLLAEAETRPTACMCAESVWWRCHRRLLADAASMLGGAEVLHLLHDRRLEDHPITEGARLDRDGRLVYDAGHTPPLEAG